METNKSLTVGERIVSTAVELARTKPIDKVTISEVAEVARVSRPTVRRHLGDKTEMRRLLAEKLGADASGHPDTKSRIIVAAWKVFAGSGYASASMDDVAATADLTKGAVYWHFPSKEDLFISCVDAGMRYEMNSVPQVVEQIFAGGELENTIANYMQMSVSNPEFFLFSRLLAEFLLNIDDEEVRDRIVKVRDESYSVWADQIRKLQKDGRIELSAEPETIVIMFNLLMRGIGLDWHGAKDRSDLEALIPQFARIMAKGM